jgi:hypothetical protein
MLSGRERAPHSVDRRDDPLAFRAWVSPRVLWSGRGIVKLLLDRALKVGLLGEEHGQHRTRGDP